MKPSIGRIVHYVAYGTPGGEYKPGEHRAAIVTAVGPETYKVDLAILNPTGLFFARGVMADEGDTDGQKVPGTWHWPEREA